MEIILIVYLSTVIAAYASQYFLGKRQRQEYTIDDISDAVLVIFVPLIPIFNLITIGEFIIYFYVRFLKETISKLIIPIGEFLVGVNRAEENNKHNRQQIYRNEEEL